MKGKHTFTIGTTDEFFKFRNVFIQNAFGTILPVARQLPGGPRERMQLLSRTRAIRSKRRFSVKQLGFYAGDEWRMSRTCR